MTDIDADRLFCSVRICFADLVLIDTFDALQHILQRCSASEYSASVALLTRRLRVGEIGLDIADRLRAGLAAQILLHALAKRLIARLRIRIARRIGGRGEHRDVRKQRGDRRLGWRACRRRPSSTGRPGPTAVCRAGVEPFSPVYQNTVLAEVPFDQRRCRVAGVPRDDLRRIREEIVGSGDGGGRRQRGLRQVGDRGGQRRLQIGGGGGRRSRRW